MRKKINLAKLYFLLAVDEQQAATRVLQSLTVAEGMRDTLGDHGETQG